LTTAVGSALTIGSSFFVFRDLRTAKKDLCQALPVLLSFSAIDFGINYPLSKIFGKRVPDYWMSTASAAAAGATIGYVYGGKCRSALAGGIIGAAYGYIRNIPLDILGLDRY
jgi:hypothetical protein